MTELVRVTRGVWRAADAVEDLAGRCAAFLSACPPASVVCGRTAARLHGMWLPPGDDEPIEVVLRSGLTPPRNRASSIRREARARRRVVLPDEVTVVHEIPVLAEARTWVDLAEDLSPPDLVAAGDSVLRGECAVDDLTRALARARGRRGVRKARSVLPLLDPRSRSRPESHIRYALITGGLPKPEVNKPIHDDVGQWIAEPDLHYRRARIAIEYNGAEHAEVKRMRKDIDRGLDVAADDWLTLVCGPTQAFRRTDQLVSLVRHYLDLRDPGWRSRTRVATSSPSGEV